MKNYTVSKVLGDLSGSISVKDNLITVEKVVGINSWGKLDYLKKLGYTVVTRYTK
jgi:hypothetical protein